MKLNFIKLFLIYFTMGILVGVFVRSHLWVYLSSHVVTGIALAGIAAFAALLLIFCPTENNDNENTGESK